MARRPQTTGNRRAARSRAVRRRRGAAALAISLLVATAAVFAIVAAATGDGRGPARGASHTRSTARPPVRPALPPRRPRAPFAVGLHFAVLVDPRRTVHFADGSTAPRRLLTEIRYPALGRPGAHDVRDAPAARAAGPFPLIVFGHGFGVTPGTYATLMRAWARAGYVVAAPLFPGENPRAPGGPTAADLPSEPGDISFVITRMLAASRAQTGVLAGLIDARRVAVSGHSDGGDAALAAADDPRLRDRRISAALILSGAEIPQLGAFAFPVNGPALLATQGSADPINLPSVTSLFFTAAHRPKFLLTLIGAQHLPPYTVQPRYRSIIERTTLAFLAYALGGRRASARRALVSAATVPGLASLAADP